MDNSFYKWNDVHTNKFLIDMPPDFFWSRIYEYPHIYGEIKKTNHYRILDAACGVYHPMKFKLAEGQYDVYACDIQGVDFQEAHDLMKTFGYELDRDLFSKIQCSIQDIVNLSYPDNFFDAVVCISVLEHIESETIISKILREFSRVLTHDGRLYLTCDYPQISPEILEHLCLREQLAITGEKDYCITEECISSSYFGNELKCFNMILYKR